MRAQKLTSAVRKEQIAQAALGMIAADGVRGLSMAAVARGVGLVPSALYRHFKGKDQLLDAVLDLIRDRLLANVEAVYEESPQCLDRLHSLLMRHIKFMKENRGVLRVFMSEDVSNGHPGRRARMYAILSGYLNRIAGIVLNGQQAGQIRRDLEPGTVSMMFLGMVQPAMILWHISDGRFDAVKHARKAWRVFSESIQSEATVT